MNNLDWNHRPRIPSDWVKVSAEQLAAFLAKENYRRNMDGCDITYNRVSNGERIAIERTKTRSALSGEAWVCPALLA